MLAAVCFARSPVGCVLTLLVSLTYTSLNSAATPNRGVAWRHYSVFSCRRKEKVPILLQLISNKALCQLGSSFRESRECFWSGFTESYRRKESVLALISWASLGWLYTGKVSSEVFHPLRITKSARPPNVNTKVTCSIMFFHSIPNICNPIHYFAGGKRHWQCEVLKKGLWKCRARGWEGFSNTKVSCLEIKASAAVWLDPRKY